MKFVVMDWADVESVRDLPKAEECMYEKAYVFPVEVKQRVVAVIAERQRLKKAYNDSFALVLQLRNELIREGVLK